MPTMMLPDNLNCTGLFAPPVQTDALRDEASLLASCPMPDSDSDWEWEAARDEREAQEIAEREAAEQARCEDRLLAECPRLKRDEEDADDGCRY